MFNNLPLEILDSVLDFVTYQGIIHLEQAYPELEENSDFYKT